jgi:hypothetical protein
LKGNNFFPHGNINKPYHETKLDPKSCNKWVCSSIMISTSTSLKIKKF